MANLYSAGTGFAGYYLAAILSSSGAPVTDQPVTIYQSDGATSALDQLWTDRTKATQASSNVIDTDGYGNLEFCADPGYYVLSFTVGGTPTTKTIEVSPDFTDAAWNDYAVTSNTTILSGDCVFVDCSSGNVTITLTSPGLGCRYKVVRTDNNFSAGYTLTVELSSGDILGPGCGSGVSSIPLNGEGAFVEIHGDSTNGHIEGGGLDTGWTACTAGSFITVACYARKIGNRTQMYGSMTATDTISPTATVAFLPSAAFAPANSGYSFAAFPSATAIEFEVESSGVIAIIGGGTSISETWYVDPWTWLTD